MDQSNTDKLTEQQRNTLLCEAITDFVVVSTTSARAYPEAAPSFAAMQDALSQILALAVGGEWIEMHDAEVKSAIDTRVKVMHSSIAARQKTLIHK